ncbi:MAG: aldo/keto reductase [Porticoccaceae bacterium]|nr:aldo/keto reductase [Porticoccaceae bacterium]
MQTTRLGRTGLQVSRLCLGTMNFGGFTEEKDSFTIMDRALDAGVQFFDTANAYGGSAGRGATETIIGNYLAQDDGARRRQIVLATKVYMPMSKSLNDGGLSARNIRMACEDSLRRLKTDHIDLYQMHHVDRNTPWEEIWQAMEQLVREGKVLYVGSSNFAGFHLAQANEIAKHRNFLGLVSEQSVYNLNQRTIELEVLPACREYGLGLIPWSPLGGGLLAGALQAANEGRRSKQFATARIEKHRAQLEAYEPLCAEIGNHPAEVGLAWVLHQEGVTAPIVGPRTMDQLESAIAATEIELSTETLEKLDEIFPGPGGSAPEAYAW